MKELKQCSGIANGTWFISMGIRCPEKTSDYFISKLQESLTIVSKIATAESSSCNPQLYNSFLDHDINFYFKTKIKKINQKQK